MSKEDKPTGLELTVTKKVDALIKKFKEVEWGAFGLSIKTGHSLESVRCNGWAELSTVIDVLHEIDGISVGDDFVGIGYDKELDECIKAISNNIRIIVEIRKEIGRLKICPRCKGMKHEKGKYKSGVHRDDKNCWQDCENCGGRGIM